MVVYQDAIDESKTWARPLSMWSEGVDAGGKKQPRFQFLAASMEALDEKPTFRLIEVIKDNMEQYQHLGEYNTLRFYHKPTGDVLEVDEGLLGRIEDGEDTGESTEERVENAGKILEHWDDYLRLPDDDVDQYRQMECFIEELPVSWRGEMERAIQGKGAFRSFKDIAARRGVLEGWYTYLAAAYRREARMWCDANGIDWWKDLIEPAGFGRHGEPASVP
jgi:hypothetical protein